MHRFGLIILRNPWKIFNNNKEKNFVANVLKDNSSIFLCPISSLENFFAYTGDKNRKRTHAEDKYIEVYQHLSKSLIIASWLLGWQLGSRL